MDDRTRYYDELEHYNSLSVDVDVINALYTYSQTARPKALMLDLCNALEVDGYYRQIDDAFALTALKSPLSVYQLRLRLKLGTISTLANDYWMSAYEWSRSVHLRSKRGYEFFKLQEFRDRMSRIKLCESDIACLLDELHGLATHSTYFMPYVHGKLGTMPSYFSGSTVRLYAEELTNAAAVAASNAKRTCATYTEDE